MFHNFLKTMAPLKNVISLVQSVSQFLFSMGTTNKLYSRKMEIYYLKKKKEVAANLITHDNHLIKGSTRVITLDTSSSEIHSILILKVKNKPSSNIYFENFFNYNYIDWTTIYVPPRLVMHNTYMRSFQYKILNNILYLNKKLHIFRKKLSFLQFSDFELLISGLASFKIFHCWCFSSLYFPIPFPYICSSLLCKRNSATCKGVFFLVEVINASIPSLLLARINTAIK